MPLVASPAVLRAGDVLRHLAAHPSQTFSVSEVARAVGLPRATCDSLLLGLADGGFVRRDRARRYQLGPACILLGDAARVANPALRAAAVHAEALARAQSAVVAVSTRDGDGTRIATVFDFGPPFGIRPRIGEGIRLVPPFGAPYVAWDDAAQIKIWLDRAEPPLTATEIARYEAALAAVRRRGYSVTVATERQPNLAEALERLVREPNSDEARRTRDEAIRVMAHSDYLAGEIDPDATARLTQVSAPVFEPGGAVAASILLLGPSHELTAAEIVASGELVRDAAQRATSDAGGHPRE